VFAVADQYRKPYLDADAIIAWIKGESRNGIPCKPIVDHILREAERGTFRIGMSTLLIAEVHKPRHSSSLNPVQDDYLIRFFQRSFFDVIEVDRDIAESANRFCRQFGIYPNDAIHLASALRLDCDVLLSWDQRFTRVAHPDIRCENPQIRGQLPLLEGESE